MVSHLLTSYRHLMLQHGYLGDITVLSKEMHAPIDRFVAVDIVLSFANGPFQNETQQGFDYGSCQDRMALCSRSQDQIRHYSPTWGGSLFYSLRSRRGLIAPLTECHFHRYIC